MPFVAGLKFDASSVVLLTQKKEVVKIKVDFKSKGGDVLLNLVACCLSPVAVERESGEM